jgi:hypothetical protein
MVAVSDAGLAPLRGVQVPADEPPADCERIVAIAVSSTELLRPGSDLLRVIAGASHVDLLLACEDEPVADPSPVGVLGSSVVDAEHLRVDDEDRPSPDLDDDVDDLDGPDDVEPDEIDDVLVAIDLLGLPNLHVHRLGLRPPLGSTAAGDLVAALSELVGFDPDPGVHCLAPTALPGDAVRSVVDRAARQIAQIYGLPLMRYGCLELSVVEGA